MSDSEQQTVEPTAPRGWWARLNAPRCGGYLPTIRSWIVVTVCVSLAALAQPLGPFVDRAVANILTLIFGFFGAMSLLLWFVRRSAYPSLVRRLVVLTLLGLIVVGIACVRIDELDGNLVPKKWRFVGAKKADERLDRIAAAAADNAIDLTTVTPDDFPEFLGAGRRNVVTGRNLVKDWSGNPPKLLWKKSIGAGWSAFSVVNGFAITMEQRGQDELVTCYEARTGKLIWSHVEQSRHETVLGGVGPRSTPTIHDGKVYALGALGMLLCLDGATGEVVWRFDLLAERGSTPELDPKVVAWGRSNSPLIVDDLVVVPAGGPPQGKFVSLIALDRATGKKVWEGGDRQVSYASPTLAELAGQRQILSVNEDNLSAHDPASGKVLWEYPWPGNSTQNASASQPVVLPGDRVLLSKAYGGGAVLLQLKRAESGSWEATELWKNSRVLKTKFTNVAVRGNEVFGLSDGILECVDLQSGRSHWKKGRYEHGQLLLVDDVLLVLSESGELVMVDASPKAHYELSRLPALQGKTWNNLCLAGRLLLIRNGEEAACFELP